MRPPASCAALCTSRKSWRRDPPAAPRDVNVGAQSYFDALSTMLMHTKGVLIMTPRSNMVLTGRLALEASGSVAAEDEVAIGGFERVMGPNGEAQYYARNLAEGYRILYDHYRYTYVVPG